ncbi:MAG: family 20 glycosylhydrolase, partial [Lysobacter sp.]|nr:family 20 glycosylhydrolase [Lysobacter sp.]
AAPREQAAHDGERASATRDTDTIAAHRTAIIPRPLKTQAQRGQFEFAANTPVQVQAGQAGERRVADYFATKVKALRGFAPVIAETQAASNGARNAIALSIDPDLATGEEAYVLDIQPDGVRIRARTEAGLFYGAVSLWQLLTADGGQGATRIAAQRIEDAPAYPWRGVMLDVARHFRSVDEVKSVVDQMALHKLNTFHWHLTDDQGWRIEIKQYPRLTQVGGCRVLAGANGRDAQGKPRPYCGYYTQDQIRDVVAYAAARHITVVPEIEMPGHAQAAIAAYPNLGVTDVVRKAPRVSPDWGVHTYLFGVDDSTFTFLENVLDEVAALFPSKYIHIGGDEAAKDQWIASRKVQARIKALGLKDEMALQSWFVGRIGQHLRTHGRILLGWDEILEDRQLYLDYVQSDRDDEPPGRFPASTLRDFYEFSIVPAELTAQQSRHVIGAQANLWSEHRRSFQGIQTTLYPRLDALAEVVWSPPASRDWNDFQQRLAPQLARYRAQDVLVSDVAYAVSFKVVDGADGQPRLSLSNQAGFGESRRTSAGLRSCREGYNLRLEDDAARDGSRDGARAALTVNLIDPCWIYPAASLDGVGRIEVQVGQLPYNFQLWHDTDKIVTRKAVQGGALEVRLDDCKSAPIARLPLAAAKRSDGITTLSANLPARSGRHDLCFVFASGAHDPLWALDAVTLHPGE